MQLCKRCHQVSQSHCTKCWSIRFVAPSIGADKGKVSHDDAAKDIEHLCAAVAVPYIAEYDLKSDLVVVSMADQKTEFGETNPDATQFFEAFRVQNDICIWEAF